MGFEELRKELCEKCTRIDSEDARSFLKMLNNEAAVDCMRNTYKAYSILKPFWKKKMNSIVDMIQHTPAEAEHVDDDNAELVDLFQHVVKYVKLHMHSSDLEVRRWASICAALDGDSGALKGCINAMKYVVDDPKVRIALMASLNYTIDTCNQKGCFTKPWSEPRTE